MNSNLIKNKKIEEMIYLIRDKQVMVDSDLAMLYEVETKVLNQAVKRNIKRFPEEFMFRLTDEENSNLRSQIVTSRWEPQYGGRRYNPYVFTEQGIAMLSSVLKSDIAIKTSIQIMNTFIKIREFLYDNKMLFNKINTIEINQIEYQTKTNKKLKDINYKLDEVFEYTATKKEVSQKIFFDGQIYDAFSLFVEIIKSANRNILLIDNYVDTKTLNILCKRKDNIKITIYTKNRTKLTSEDIDKFNLQYKNLEVKNIETFHDRFLIIDNKKCYHIGASLKDAGNKSFAISELNDKSVVKSILEKLGWNKFD